MCLEAEALEAFFPWSRTGHFDELNVRLFLGKLTLAQTLALKIGGYNVFS